MEKCLICGTTRKKKIGDHVIKRHGLSLKEYYIKYILKLSSPPKCSCGKSLTFYDLKRGFSQYCSKSCRMSHPDNQNLKSLTRTKDHNRKIKESNKKNWINNRDDRLRRVREAYKNNKTHSKNVSLGQQRLWSDETYREKSLKRIMRDNNPGKHKIKTPYGEFSVRSNLEKEFLLLAVESEQVSSIKYECLRIPYEIDGKRRDYIPDFLINDTDLIEIKPGNRINIKPTLVKEKYAKEYCRNNGLNYLILSPKRFSQYLSSINEKEDSENSHE